MPGPKLGHKKSFSANILLFKTQISLVIISSTWQMKYLAKYIGISCKTELFCKMVLSTSCRTNFLLEYFVVDWANFLLKVTQNACRDLACMVNIFGFGYS